MKFYQLSGPAQAIQYTGTVESAEAILAFLKVEGSAQSSQGVLEVDGVRVEQPGPLHIDEMIIPVGSWVVLYANAFPPEAIVCSESAFQDMFKEIPTQMIHESSWQAFADAGLFWWVNRALHLFGWALCREVRPDGAITAVYPARCKFRGFDTQTESEGFTKLTHHLNQRMPELLEDVKD